MSCPDMTKFFFFSFFFFYCRYRGWGGGWKPKCECASIILYSPIIENKNPHIFRQNRNTTHILTLCTCLVSLFLSFSFFSFLYSLPSQRFFLGDVRSARHGFTLAEWRCMYYSGIYYLNLKVCFE